MTTNPLKQYFRRPALYLKLPSGGNNYAPGVIDLPENGDIPVYPMTAIDEITARTPDALFNGTAVHDLMKSCVPAIIQPWSIYSTDLDAILIAIKAASKGSDLEIESECPECKETSKYGINLSALLLNLKSGDYTKELNIDELYIKFRPLVYKEMNQINLEQFELTKLIASAEGKSDEDKAKINQEATKKVTDLTIDILAQTMEYVKTPIGMVTEKEFFIDFLKNCDRNVFTKIRDYTTELKEQTEMPAIPLTCVQCSHPYETKFTLNVTDFFG